MNEGTPIILGTDIERVTTINSSYAIDQINIYTKDGQTYRMHISELLPLIQKQQFIAAKKRKYYHLTLPS